MISLCAHSGRDSRYPIQLIFKWCARVFLHFDFYVTAAGTRRPCARVFAVWKDNKYCFEIVYSHQQEFHPRQSCYQDAKIHRRTKSTLEKMRKIEDKEEEGKKVQLIFERRSRWFLESSNILFPLCCKFLNNYLSFLMLLRLLRDFNWTKMLWKREIQINDGVFT